MCGIVGMSFRCGVYNRHANMVKIKETFTSMLVAAQSRGSSATGIAMMTCAEGATKTDAWVLRSPLPAKEFVETKEYKEILKKVDTNCLSIVGHTRAVAGNNAVAENNHNNHPHVHGSIIGVHNGRVTNDGELWEKYNGSDAAKGICDSEVVIYMVNRFLETGAAETTEEAIEMAVSQLVGWHALAFLNTKSPNKVYLVKDKSTPLSLGWWGQPEITVFASEWRYVEDAHEKAYPSVSTSTAIKRCAMPSNQIITLDSTVKGDSWTDLFVGRHTIKKNTDTDVLTAHAEEFRITQGK